MSTALSYLRSEVYEHALVQLGGGTVTGNQISVLLVPCHKLRMR